LTTLQSRPARWARAGQALLLLAGIALAGTVAAAPSFVCKKAKSWTEKAVCASARLSDLDLKLAVARARLLKSATPQGQKVLDAEQQSWWNALADCRSASDPAACLADRYMHRIAALESRPEFPKAGRRVRVDESIVPIATEGRGWTRDLSRYQRALRACREETPNPVARLMVAWSAGDGESVGLHLVDWQMKEYVCIAHIEGHKVFRFEPRAAGEVLPPPGPVYHIGGDAPPAGCPSATQVLDVNGRSVGWISDANC
jgi:uncharacterized protein